MLMKRVVVMNRIITSILSLIIFFTFAGCNSSMSSNDDKESRNLYTLLAILYVTRPLCAYTDSAGVTHQLSLIVANENEQLLNLNRLPDNNIFAGAIEITTHIGNKLIVTYQSGAPGYDFMLDQHCPIDASTANNVYTSYTATYSTNGVEYLFSVAGEYTLIFQAYENSSIKVKLQ